MKVWKIVRDNDYETSATLYADEAKAREAFAEEIADYWNHWMGDKPMPEDTDEAWDYITNNSGCVDTLYLAEDNIALPTVYEAGPDLLDALEEAEGFIQGFADDETQEGMDELCATIEAAVKKARGEVLEERG